MKITRFDSIDSTNKAIKEAIRLGAPEGAVVLAREQTQGYGRQGRGWASPIGGLYFSMLLRPQAQGLSVEDLPTLSLVVSLAIRQALSEDFLQAARESGGTPGDKIAVKWPNDIFYDDRKLVGISLEALSDGVCVGIGVNVFPPDQPVEVVGKNEPAYYAELTGDQQRISSEKQKDYLEALAAYLLSTFARYYRKWLKKGFVAFVSEYNRYSYLTDKQVTIADRAGRTIDSGIIRSIDEEGRLQLENKEGTLHPITSGEVHLIF